MLSHMRRYVIFSSFFARFNVAAAAANYAANLTNISYDLLIARRAIKIGMFRRYNERR